MDTRLTHLLKRLFPTWRDLDKSCWISMAIDGPQEDFGDLIYAIAEAGDIGAFGGRLTSQHPTGVMHSRRHDDRLLDVFAEGAAFAWAYEVSRLGTPRFVAAPGSPDILVGDVWVEAKNIRHSREEAAFQETVVNPPP